MSLKKKAISGFKWTTVSSLLIVIIQLIQLAILTHYLDASDFGLMAIVTVIIGFSALFMDMGISASIIHRQAITHRQLSSLYWLNIASGVILFITVYSLAPILAHFYNETELIPIVRLLSITFIISGIGNQYGILFQKALKFHLIAKINIISTMIAFIIAVSLAAKGYGVYSLISASLTKVVVSTSANVFIGLREHKPSLVYAHHEITAMISFGMFQMGERVLNYFNLQFDVILIGKLLGVEALGIYSVAKNLSMRPAQIINPIITKVTFPIMAKIQNDNSRLKAIYLKTITYLSSVNFPLYILMAILAEPIVLTMFGDKWEKSIVILQILSIYGAIRSTGNPIGTLLLSKGRVELGFYWNLGLIVFIPLFIYVGSNWELVGVAYSLLGLQILVLIPRWCFLVKPLCGAGFSSYFRQIFKPLLIAMSGTTVGYGVSLLSDIENMYLDSIVIVVVTGIVVFMMSFFFNRDFIDTILEMVGKRKKTQ